jgi:hypothetical protein
MEEAIVEVGRGRDVGRGTAAAVETHVEHCETCARKLSRERQVSGGLRALAAATAAEAPSALLERRLRDAFAAHHRTSVVRRWPWVGAAAAAAAIAVLGWWQVTRVQPERSSADPVREARASVPPAAPAPAAATAAGRSTAGTPATSPATAASRARSTRSPARRAGSENANANAGAGFVAVPAAEGLPPFESGVIVRVEMPPAALTAYGIEIVPDAEAPVEADLLIGQDGRARAIRLVTHTSRVDSKD